MQHRQIALCVLPSLMQEGFCPFVSLSLNRYVHNDKAVGKGDSVLHYSMNKFAGINSYPEPHPVLQL